MDFGVTPGSWAKALPSSAADIERLRDRLTQLLGITASLAIEQTDLLMPESSGKFRLGVPGPA